MNAPITMSPSALVQSAYVVPFPPYPFQVESVDKLADLPRSGMYHEAGLGKTSTSTLCSLYKFLVHGVDLVIVVMPPILLTNWCRYLRSIHNATTKQPLKVLAYRGSPKERTAMTFDGVDFVLMSMQIFKRDVDKIETLCNGRVVHLKVDEATSIKNVGSQNYKTVSSFVVNRSLQLLTGTPLNSPADGYAYIKLVSPTIYRTQYQFENIHVAERDFFGNVTGWSHLDLLQENLLCNADRRIKEQVLLDLPPALINPIYYDLTPAHSKLYKQLAEEQLLRFEDGTKLDATHVSALTHALGQIICNLEHFSKKEGDEAQIYDLIDETLDELGSGKLVVFTHYRMTSRKMTERYSESHNAVAVWGDISPKQKEKALETFINDPACRLIILQQVSAGLGIDGLQRVCSDCLFIEVPGTSLLFEQAMSRLYRDGQKKSVNVRVAVANGTLQVRTLKNVSIKQDLVNSIQGGLSNLRAAVFGN